jgi:phosphoribosylanthranilate isomerase
MKIKVCGMKNPENIREISVLSPDYMGFIFYPKSKRYAGELNEEVVKNLNHLIKVGVFVNEEALCIKEICKRYNINFIQLHGNENPALCQELKSEGFKIIKVFSVGEHFEFSETNAYKKVADYFLFDTKSESYGGTGKKFNWSLFEHYDNQKEIFLSGGIGPDDVEEIKKLKSLNIHALDINSKFEIEPGLKDVGLVRKFIERIGSRQ